MFRGGLALLHMKQTELIKLDVEGMMNVNEHLNETKFSFVCHLLALRILKMCFYNHCVFEIFPLYEFSWCSE